MMEKISRTTPDLTQENIDKLAELFPDVVTENVDVDGNVVRAIDFDALRDDLSGSVVEGRRERYQFTWPGKAKAKLEARTPTSKTMRPCPEKSVDWDTTENLYIEGDNLEALKIMRETYAGKVKLIYIDPPYNTGHDFIYDDVFAQSRADYDAESGDYDELGSRLVENTTANGRFHSVWCSNIYSRLLLARDLLSKDGAIFISIDDNEQENLRKICDEIFGATNFVSTIIWEKRYSPQNAVQWFSESHDFILCYAKEINSWRPNLLPRSSEMDARYTNRDNDPRGPWKAENATAQGGHGTASQFYPLTLPSGRTVEPPAGRCWLYTLPRFNEMVADNRIWFGEDGDNAPAIKRFLSEVKQGIACQTIWKYDEVGHSQEGKKELRDLFVDIVPFDTPKPVRLMKRILQVATDTDSLVLDFYSGSASMAHAVLEKNEEDGGSRKFILVQLPEGALGEYATLCDVGEERIRRAGTIIRAEVEESNRQLRLGEEPKPIPDLGFRVLRVGDSALRNVNADPASTSQATLLDLIDNLEEDAGPLDLLFQVLPKFRIPYSCKIEEREVDGRTVLDVNGGQLLACFDEDVSSATVEAIAKARPVYAVFRDSSFADDSAVANLEELFKTFSPDTIYRVI